MDPSLFGCDESRKIHLTQLKKFVTPDECKFKDQNLQMGADHDKACFELGMMYRLGEGVSVNTFLSRAYLEKAKELGHPRADQYL